MTDRAIRASDRDRESVVAILRDAFAEGRLTLDEFDQRVSEAYAARTWGELMDLTADLPVQLELSTGNPPSTLPAPFPRVRVPAQQAPRPEAQANLALPRSPVRRGPDVRLLPALFIWAVIAVAAGDPWVAGILTVFLVGLLASRWGARGDPGNGPPRGQ